MTADTDVRSQVSEVSKSEIEEKCALDMSSYQDLPKVGEDCNGIKHVDGGNGKDDPDGSYVFVSGTGVVTGDSIDKDLNAKEEESEVVPDSEVGPPNNDVEVQVGELSVEKGGIFQSRVDENNCIGGGDDVVTLNNDVDVQIGELNVENRKKFQSSVDNEPDAGSESSLGKPDGEGAEFARTDMVEEQNGTAIMEPEPQQLDPEVKVEDRIELDFNPNPEENQESHITVADLGEIQESITMSSVAGDSHDASLKSEEQDNLDSTAELGLSQKCQGVSLEAAGCELSEVKAGEVMSEEQIKLESPREVEETLESQIITTKSVDSRSYHLDNVEEAHEVKNNAILVTDESAREVKESLDSQIIITEFAESGSSQLDNGEEKLEEKNSADLVTDESAREVKESMDSQIIITKLAESGSFQLDNGEEKLEEKSSGDLVTDESAREVKESMDSQIVITKLAESESSQLDNGEEKLEEKNADLVTDGLASEVKESMDSQIVITKLAESGSSQLDNGEEKLKAKNADLVTDGSASEVKESMDSQIVITKLAESGSSQLDNGEEKLEGKNNTDLVTDESAREVKVSLDKLAQSGSSQLDNGEEKLEENKDLVTDESARAVKESMDSQIAITKLAESGSSQLDNGEEKLEEMNNADLDIDVKENQECQVVVTDNFQSGSIQRNEAAKLANETDAPLETEIARNIVLGENTGPEREVLGECIDGSQKCPDLSENRENAEGLPSPVANCVIPESESGNVTSECGGSFLAGADDGSVVEQEVGYGASQVTENFPTCAADDTKCETEVEKHDDKNKEGVLSCHADNAKSETEVKNGPVGGDDTSCCPAKHVSSETEIVYGSIGLEEKIPTLLCDDMHGESEASNGDSEFIHIQSVSANYLDPEYNSLRNGSCADVKTESDADNSSEILDAIVVNGESAANSVPAIVNVENAGDQVNGGDEAQANKVLCQETKDSVGIHRDEVPASLPEGSVADAMDGQNVGAEAVVRPFHFLIRMPRFDDEKLKEQIRNARLQVDEKTQRRDAIRMEIHIKRDNYQAYGEKYEAAKSEERAARKLVKLKRQEIDSVLSVLNRVKNANSVEEIDGRIYNMEHMIEHETLPLKEEKQFIRDIKQLKHLREQLASNLGSLDEVQQARDQRDQLEERLKILKKELDGLKERVSKAELTTLAVGRKYDDESRKLKELQTQFKAADAIRQEAYKHFHILNRQMSDKSKHFWKYRDDAKASSDLALSRDRGAVHRLCVNQVEKIMELWNKNDEFRKEYVRCNMRSTVRRLRTLDGRSLGPDEEPPVLPSYVDERVDAFVANPGKANSVPMVSTEQGKQVSVVKGQEADGKSREKVSEENNQTLKTKNTAEPGLEIGKATVTGRDEAEERTEEENIQMKRQQELAKKAEELRKKEDEAKLKEQRRLEEKAKAQEAIERKKRNAEKAQIRAELRAQKEAEQKEKEREKRLKKKERKKAATTDAHDDGETAPPSEILTETTKDDSPTTITKRQSKASHFPKQSKPKAIPPPLRNRGKRRMQQWIWLILAAVLLVSLFLLGNSGFFFTLRTQKSGF